MYLYEYKFVRSFNILSVSTLVVYTSYYRARVNLRFLQESVALSMSVQKLADISRHSLKVHEIS